MKISEKLRQAEKESAAEVEKRMNNKTSKINACDYEWCREWFG